MSSTLRNFSQIPVRTKYFLTVSAFTQGQVTANPPNYDDPAIYFVNGYPGPIINENDMLSVTYPLFGTGKLLKDLGRQVTIVNDAGAHVAVYCEVQRVNGAGTEGVGPQVTPDGPYGTFFIKVWSADGSNVLVARTG